MRFFFSFVLQANCGPFDAYRMILYASTLTQNLASTAHHTATFSMCAVSYIILVLCKQICNKYSIMQMCYRIYVHSA